MSATSATNFVDVLKDRRAHCRELLELSRLQRRFIDADNPIGLLQVLGRKQRILGSMDALAGRQTSLKQSWRAERAAMDPGLREECEHVLAETEAIFEELLQEERDSTEYLICRRDSARHQIEAVARAPRAPLPYRGGLASSTPK